MSHILRNEFSLLVVLFGVSGRVGGFFIFSSMVWGLLFYLTHLLGSGY